MLILRRFISSIKNCPIKGASLLSRIVSRILISKPRGEIVINTIYDFKLKINPVIDKGVEHSLYYYGTYEKGTLHILGNILNQGDVFVDIGANIGLMTVFSAIKVGEKGKVFAFEPNPNTRQLLEENILLNNLKNIKTESFALSNVSKDSKIYDRWEINRGASSLIKPDKSTKSYTIKETSFSEYFDFKQEIKLVKIDVEGFEMEVLKGMKTYLLNTRVLPVLIIEFSVMRVNTFGKNTSLLYEFLRNLKYLIFKSTANKEKIAKLVEIRSEKELPEHDNIYGFTNSHINQLLKGIFKNLPKV